MGTICTPPSHSDGGRCPARQLRQYGGVAAHHSVNTVPEGFPVNRRSAEEGGTIRGNARKALEAKSGQPVVSASNNLYIAPGAAALGGKVGSKTPADEPATTQKSKPKVPAKVLATTGKKARGG